jgi:hypothetical protein
VKADRRAVLKGGAVLGVAAGLPLAARASAPALTVFDSRLPESAAFARTRRSGLQLDLATASLRTLPVASRIEGLTGWSDWIDLRGELELRGLRLLSEDRVQATLSGRAHLFRWSMQAR